MPATFDPEKFRNVLPYASELFGVYQPLLGWKSTRTVQRFRPGLIDSKFKIVDALLSKITPDTAVNITDFNNNDIFFEIAKLNPGTLNPRNRTSLALPYQLYITSLVEQKLIENRLDKRKPGI